MPRKRLSKILEAGPTYDVVVIGGGSAGMAAAESARAAGAKKVCIVEHGMLGGECPTWACVPTKALLRSAKLYAHAKHVLPKFGIRTGRVSFDFSAIIRRKQAVVEVITGGGQRLSDHAQKQHIEVRHGSAAFTGLRTLSVDGLRLKASAFVVATGSKEVVLDIPGIEEVRPWYSRELVSLTSLPSSIIIIGGGPIGCEFATFFSMLGVKTTLLEAGPHILPREDGEIAALAEAALQRHGARVFTKTLPLSVKKRGRGVELTVQVGRRPRQTVTAEALAVAIGRRPNIDGLSLDKAEVRRDDRGNIVTDAFCGTSAEHVFVAGDSAGGAQFTHLAHHEGAIAGWNAAQVGSGVKKAKVDLRVVPRVTFTDPEVASVGLTLEQATRQKLGYHLYRFPVGALGRAAVDGARDGLLKVIVDEDSGLILGAHLLGERAGEVIHELALAMQANIPFADVQNMIHAYPTWSEAIPAAF